MAYDKTEPIGTASPRQSPGGTFGAPPPEPPQASAWARAIRFISAALPMTVALSIGGVAVDAILPEPVKPSTLIGSWLGKVNRAEVETQQAIVVENTRRMAEAQATANAKAQMEIIAFQHQMQAAMDAMQGKIAMANAADVTCTLGPIGVALMFQPGSADARNAAQIVQAACAFAAQTRQEIAAEQARIARLNSAIMERQAVVGSR